MMKIARVSQDRLTVHLVYPDPRAADGGPYWSLCGRNLDAATVFESRMPFTEHLTPCRACQRVKEAHA